ncbi:MULTISPECIES: putative quinol monooxygenase [Vibrio]|uniref:Antibiotic biosynthesis monooxygenase n=1 Tax=Vibrio casei TaxID=673372 RepID=A0A368LNC1_9VIBR|nr:MULTISPECIES: antibiotic biosynthesis monooxygenase [Vibrio]RCS73301.1 antibiotic biosynthesis monooxygenase [Vibrio casei]SJN18088.1 Arginase/agmatinase/formimionoglutamate hydrolase [Vibrio casei]HBV75772.1 antibiotic biosynthesis monooxygenase [Vibrio sp.]
MSKVILKGHILVSDEDLAAVKNELVNHKRLTKAEPGCLTFEVSQCKIIPNKFNVYEEFADKNSFESHQIRVKASSWGKITTHVKRYYEIILPPI